LSTTIKVSKVRVLGEPTGSTETRPTTDLAQTPQSHASQRASAAAGTPTRTQLPRRLMILEPPQPLSAINDDPVFEYRDAAEILGVSPELVEKWRQRYEGPDFIQYGGPGGPVRYALSALMAYREHFTVRRWSFPRGTSK
jgi:hypothetical protein